MNRREALDRSPGALWPRSVVRLAGATTVGGGLLFLAGWWGVTDTETMSGQLGWLSLSLGGVAVAGAGEVMVLLTGRRAVGLLRRAVLPAHGQVTSSVPALAREPRLLPIPGPGGFVAVPGTRRYHRPGCLLVAGKNVVRLGEPGAEHPQACEVCGS